MKELLWLTVIGLSMGLFAIFGFGFIQFVILIIFILLAGNIVSRFTL